MTIIVTPNDAGLDALAAMVAAANVYPGSSALLPEKLQPDAALFVDSYGDQLPVRQSAGSDDCPGADVVVVVGGRRRSGFGAFLPLIEGARQVHIYDHHPPSPDDLEGSGSWAESVGAVTTLLIEEIRRRRIPLSELESTLALLGIYQATGSLGEAGTTARDAAAAAFLWEQGVDRPLLQAYRRAGPAAGGGESLLVRLLEAGELFEICGRRILLAEVTVEEHLRGMGALAGRLQQIEMFDLALILAALPQGDIRLTALTTADDLDLALLLAPLGASGSRRAASAAIKAEEAAALKKRLLELLERYLPPAAVAAQIAAAPAATAGAAWSVARVAEFLDAGGYGGCPVVEQGRVVGMITRSELQKALRSGLGDSPVQGFMRRDRVTASARSTLTALRRMLVENKSGRVALVGDEGEPLGMITPIDILRYLESLDGGQSESCIAAGDLLEIEESPPPASVDNMGSLIRSKLPPRRQSRLLYIGQRASAAGVSVFLVGGVIRDLLLGSGLSKDLDFVVFPDAVNFAGELAKLLGGRLKIFEPFGTASLFLEDGIRLDFATARREFYAAPAALPQVEGTESLKSDLFRRDFTINTLACSLLPGSFGKLYDFFEGRKDLERGVIRSLYHLSFVDDPLRLLRAVRFEQRFRFQIEEETLEMMAKALHDRALEKVTRPRLAQEVSLIYEEADPAAVLMRLQELKILGLIYPRLAPDAGTWQRLNRIGEALDWAERREWSRPPDKELIYLSGLLLGMDPRERLAALRPLSLSRRRAGVVLEGCLQAPSLLAEFSEAGGASLRPGILVNRLDPLSPESLILLYALAGSGAVRDHLRLYLESLRHVRPRLRGGALKELGLRPGPLFGEILGALRRGVLDGELRTFEEELDFVITYLKRREEA